MKHPTSAIQSVLGSSTSHCFPAYGYKGSFVLSLPSVWLSIFCVNANRVPTAIKSQVTKLFPIYHRLWSSYPPCEMYLVPIAPIFTNLKLSFREVSNLFRTLQLIGDKVDKIRS
jgi:hypothetical protein